jgi:hypothetical protein
MKEFVNKYKCDDDPNFDYSLYEDAINQLRNELNKDNVKKALSPQRSKQIHIYNYLLFLDF